MALEEYQGVEFNEEKYMPEASVTEKGGFYAFLLSKGLVKNQNQANLVLAIFAVLLILLAYTISQTFVGGHSNAPKLTPEDSYRAGNPNEIDNTIR